MSNRFVRLLDYRPEKIWRGTVLRLRGWHPYENIVDFMIVEDNTFDKRPLAIVVSTGYKAGIVLSVLPEKCFFSNQSAIRSIWLKENWDIMFDQCPVECVMISDGYGAPKNFEIDCIV